MKKLLFLSLFALALSVFSTAQSVDSSAIEIPAKLTKEQHWFIIGSLQDKGTPDAQNYINQVARDKDTSRAKDLITYNPLRFIAVIYRKQTGLKEGVAERLNALMKTALMPQILQQSWLLRELGIIIEANRREERELIEAGREYCQQIKY